MDEELTIYGPNLLSIEVPDWANCDDGYTPTSATEISIVRSIKSIAVSYRPNTTLGIGYAKIFILDKDTKKPFSRMTDMWKEVNWRFTHGKMSLNQIHTGGWAYTIPIVPRQESEKPLYNMDEFGRIRNAFGAPKAPELRWLVAELVEMYQTWRKFPNETDWETIEKLKSAKCDIYAMQMNAQQYEQQIKDARRNIQEYQDKIAEWEKNMNEMYERGADAMNLLEEHGVSIDLDKPERFNEEELLEEEIMNGIGYDINPDLYTIKYNPGEENHIIRMPTHERDSICSMVAE